MTSSSNNIKDQTNDRLRLGEKTAAEISKIFAQSSIADDWIPKQNPFTDFFQRQRKPKSTILDQSTKANTNVVSYKTEVFDFSNALYTNHEDGRAAKTIAGSITNSTKNEAGKLENGILANN